MKNAIKGFLREEDGASLAEYGVLVALILLVCIALISTFGGKIKQTFTDINTSLTP